MKAKSPQPRSGEAPKPPLRASARIAEQKKRPSKQVNVPAEPLALKPARKRTTEGKQKPSRPKSRATTKPKEIAKKKETRPRPPQGRPLRNIRKRTLQEHERDTANDPLPQDLAQWKSDRDPLRSDEFGNSDDSDSEMATWDTAMPEALDESGFFDEMWSDENEDFKEPSKLRKVLEEMKSMSSDHIDEVKLKQDYKDWVETILAPTFSEDSAGMWFYAYMDIPLLKLPSPHYKEDNEQWIVSPDSQVKPWKPKPDYVEGINGRLLPMWITQALGAYVKPESKLALPNFMVEYKGKGSMKIAHQQARLDGGFGSQGFFKLYDYLKKDLGHCFDQPLVGTVEYNGEIIIGNVHWATRSTSSTTGVEYHMRRVMAHFTRGVSFDQFAKNRTAMRSFRQYFANIRENILRKLQEIPAGKMQENYGKMSRNDLSLLCQERTILVGKVGEMRQRLQEDDTRRATEAALATLGPSDTQESADNVFAPSSRVPDGASLNTPGSSFKRLHVSTEEDSEEQTSPLSKRLKK